MLTQVLLALHRVDHAKHGKLPICHYVGRRNRPVSELDIPVQVPSQTVYAFHSAANIWKVGQSDN